MPTATSPRWSWLARAALVVGGLVCFGANHAVVHAIRGLTHDLDVTLPLYGLACVALTVWYALFLRHLVRTEGERPAARVTWLALGVVVAAAHLATPPQGSIDALTYVVHGQHHVELGVDPYVGIPADALAGPHGAVLRDLGYYAAHAHPSPYGPLWSVVEAAVWWATGDVRRAVRVYQALGLAALLGCAAMLAARARGGAAGGPAPSTVALAFLWNPVVMLEAAWDAHVDVTAYALVLGALLRVERAPRGWSWAALAAAAVDVKLLFGVFVPALAVRAARGSGARGLAAALARFGATWALLSAVLYTPYWDGWATLRPLWQHTQRDTLTLAFGVASLTAACGLAWRERSAGARSIQVTTALPATLLGGSYWLPWYSTASLGELLLMGARASVYVVVLTLFGRLATGVYFTALQHYGGRVPWPAALRLPTAVYRVALASLLGVFLARVAVGRRRLAAAAAASSFTPRT